MSASALSILFRHRSSPDKREQRRIQVLATYGRMADGVITDAHDGVLYYTYNVSGVIYTASQDVQRLLDQLPDLPERLIGPVTLKYSVRNPANSILISDDWSGLRRPPQRPYAEERTGEIENEA